MDAAISPPLNLLIVETQPAQAERYLQELKKDGLACRAEPIQSAHELAAHVAAKPYHAILLDAALPGGAGGDVLELLQQMDKDIPVILIGDPAEAPAAMNLLRQGATDFLARDRLERLPAAVRQAVERKSLREERARAEHAWRECEQRYQRLVELSPDPMLVAVADKVVVANPSAAKLWGGDHADRLLDLELMRLVHPDSRSEVRRRLDRLGTVQDAEVFEARLLRLDGQGLLARLAAVGLRYHGQPAVKLVARDVSDRKRVEETIQSLAAFAQLNPNPVLEFSREGKLTYFNAAADELAKSLGKEHPSAMMPAETLSIVQLCLTSGQKRLQVEKSMGGRTFSWSFFPLTARQVVHCYVSEITDRLNLESQLRHAQKLESVGRLAAGVAHDFNNILTVIKGHTGLLRAEPSLSPEMFESLQQVSRAAERASRLASQLLAFTRRSTLDLRRLDLNEVLANLSNLLRRTLGEDVSFEFRYGRNLPPIHADLSLVEQVVINLAVNARDAMPKGGQFVIQTSLEDIDAAYLQRQPEGRVGQFICLTMTDSGCGMDHVTLGRLFEPFFTTKEFGKGTGLGLATVYGIVKRHQGWIDVQSQIGRGSAFRIYFPPMDRAAESAAAKPGDAVSGGQETVLVVEDEAPVLRIMKSVLERYGYRVLEAANGVEALGVWHSHQNDIAVLLTDMVMPVGLSGQELADKFKALKPNLRVIYTSGYSVEVAGKNLSLMEGLNFLQKPFDSEKLALAVRRCLDN